MVGTMDYRMFLAALLVGVANGESQATLLSRNPEYLGYGGGVTLTIHGTGFSEDQFSQVDPTLGNTVILVNAADVIDCDVIFNLTTTEQIVCNSRPKVNEAAPGIYTIKVFVDGEEADGSLTVEYVENVSPVVEGISPVWSLPGALVELYGQTRTDSYNNTSDPVNSDPDEGAVLTKVHVGNVVCEMVDPTTDDLYGFNETGLTCLIKSKYVGPMNGSLYVTTKGASVKNGSAMYVDSQDRLYQHHTYAGVNSVSPSSGSPGGSTLITVTGVGFDPYPGKTEVRVGGADCKIQEITDNTITCLTPAQGLTAPGSRERGLQWEFWEGHDLDISNDVEWATLDSTHPSYSTDFILDAHHFVEMSSPSVGKLSGYFNAPHDGKYALGVEDSSLIYVSSTGLPSDLMLVANLEEISLTRDTAAYFEVRFRGTNSTLLKLSMLDYDGLYTHAQTHTAENEVHKINLDPQEEYETQRLTSEGQPDHAKLYLNGMTSDPIDVSDRAQVQSAVLGLLEWQCEYQASNADYLHQSGYEEGEDLPAGGIGTSVDYKEPFCGRCSLLLNRDDPRLYFERLTDKMVDLNDFPYMCFAVRGNIGEEMRANIVWRDNESTKHYTDIWFRHNIVADRNTWSYQCLNLQEAVDNSWGNNHRSDNYLKLRTIHLFGATNMDRVYVDEFTFSDKNVAVIQTRPSALSLQGILMSSVNVVAVNDNGAAALEVEFITSNCAGEFPLLGVTNGDGEPSWATELNSDATDAYFTVSGGGVTVTRIKSATNAISGTWSLTTQGVTIDGIPPEVEKEELQEMLEAATGSAGIQVTQSGNCKTMNWSIIWEDEPGSKDLTVTVDGSQLFFDGNSLSFTSVRQQRAKIAHDPLMGDFLTVRRNEPHVSLRVNGYSAACLGDCSYAFNASNLPTLSSVSGDVGDSGLHTLTIVGSDFSSSEVRDYTVTVGPADCSVTGVTSTEITCSVMQLSAGSHPISVVMQPVGAALQPNPALEYFVALSITSITPTTGGTAGGYPVVITALGSPADLSGWIGNTVTVGGANCDVTETEASAFTCIIPPGTEGVADVSVALSGASSVLPNGFTYDASLSAVMNNILPITSSVLGGDSLTITGSGFGEGTDGVVMVGSSVCVILSWFDNSIECQLPSNTPGQYDVSVYVGNAGFASGSATVTYTLKVTGSSSRKGSINGGTILVFNGEGFGSDCQLVRVDIGQDMTCDVTTCSNTQITCVTKLVFTNHIVNSNGSYGGYGEGYAWSPKNVLVKEGDNVTWAWSRVHPFTQLRYNVFQTPSPSNKTYDGSGFHSGSPSSVGSMTVPFPNAGVFSYAGDPVYEKLVMSGQVKVVKPSEEAKRVKVTLDGIEAEYALQEEGPLPTDDGCSTVLETPLDGCVSTAPSAPDSDNPYFVTDLCFTPVVTSVLPNATENLPILKEMQVRTGVTLNITGSGFGTEVCQTSVMIGPASCTVTSSDDTSITCVLDDTDTVSLQPFPVVVTVANRGTARSEDQVTVVPVVTSFTPTEGSSAGGTEITISGTGLKAFDSQGSIRLGSGECIIDSISATAIICTTVATPPSSVTLATFVSSFMVPAISDLPNSTYQFI